MDDSDFNRRAGSRIKDLREAASLSQKDLLQRMHDWGHPHYTQAQMSHWETGRRTLSLREAHTIASILGVEMSALLDDTEDLDLAALGAQQEDASAAIIERQSANAERLAALRRHQAEIAEHQATINKRQAAIAELDRQIRGAGAEIDRYQATIVRMERLMAKINDGEKDETNDEGYKEI